MFFQNHVIGTSVFEPTRARKHPLDGLLSLRSFATLEYAYKANLHPSALLPTQLANTPLLACGVGAGCGDKVLCHRLLSIWWFVLLRSDRPTHVRSTMQRKVYAVQDKACRIARGHTFLCLVLNREVVAICTWSCNCLQFCNIGFSQTVVSFYTLQYLHYQIANGLRRQTRR